MYSIKQHHHHGYVFHKICLFAVSDSLFKILPTKHFSESDSLKCGAYYFTGKEEHKKKILFAWERVFTSVWMYIYKFIFMASCLCVRARHAIHVQFKCVCVQALHLLLHYVIISNRCFLLHIHDWAYVLALSLGLQIWTRMNHIEEILSLSSN